MLNRASAGMGPIVSLSNVSHVVVKNIHLEGRLMPPQPYVPDTDTFMDNVNILLKDCDDCTVSNIISENSRVSSINVVSGSNIHIDNNEVRNNGTPEGAPFYRSDGISVHAISGNSTVANNHFVNNTDIALIIGRGSTGRLIVTGNVVGPMTLARIGTNLIAGAGVLFDTMSDWSPTWCLSHTGCPNEFYAVQFSDNINACGPQCLYGIAVGTSSNNTWGFGTTKYATPVEGLVINSSSGPTDLR